MPLRDDGRDDRRDGESNLHKHQPIRARSNFPRRVVIQLAPMVLSA